MYIMNEKISLRTWPIDDLKHTLITWHMETSYPTFQQTNTSIHQLVSFNYMFLFIIGNFAFWLYWCRWQSKIVPEVWNIFKVTNVLVIDKCNYSFHCFNSSRFIELLSLVSSSKQIFVYLFLFRPDFFRFFFWGSFLYFKELIVAKNYNIFFRA